MSDSLDMPRGSYRNGLPKTLDDLLDRGGRRGDALIDPLPPALAEELAREALTLGIKPKGPILAYVVKTLRHGLGVGDVPTPPLELNALEAPFVKARTAEALARLRTYRQEHGL